MRSQNGLEQNNLGMHSLMISSRWTTDEIWWSLYNIYLIIIISFARHSWEWSGYGNGYIIYIYTVMLLLYIYRFSMTLWYMMYIIRGVYVYIYIYQVLFICQADSGGWSVDPGCCRARLKGSCAWKRNNAVSRPGPVSMCQWQWLRRLRHACWDSV